MDPIALVFQAISQMTGGLITDMTTAIIGMVMLSFVAMGADLLLDILGNRIKKAKVDQKKLTGRYSTPGIDKEYLEDGKLTMEKPRPLSREVPYWSR